MTVTALRIISNISRVFKISRTFYTKHNLKPLTESERISLLREMALPKTRPNPIILKLDSAEFKSIFTAEVKTLATLFENHGYELRIAGGAVRDLLMGKKPTDLDFATVATPDQMKNMFTKENVRMINMNGEKHGTITPRINDKENFEVTTLRIDVVTDGRHAEVQFTTDWMLDSLRRDLTINSMFLGLDGSVYDYFYGYEDLKTHRVKFVGDPATRIQEDYLRILRYFRFYGKIAQEPDQHEDDCVKAITENRKGLSEVSGERIWMELKKILEGNYAGELLLKIIDCGLALYIGLPENPNCAELKQVWDRSRNLKLHAITLLASTLHNLDDAVALNSRLKLSAFERDLAVFVVEHRAPKPHEKPLKPYQQLVLKSKIKDAFSYIVEILKYNNSPYLEEFQNWSIPKFPVNGKMLKENGVESGKFMGIVMTELKNYWADNDFNLSDVELLKQLPYIVNDLKERKRNK